MLAAGREGDASSSRASCSTDPVELLAVSSSLRGSLCALCELAAAEAIVSQAELSSLLQLSEAARVGAGAAIAFAVSSGFADVVDPGPGSPSRAIAGSWVTVGEASVCV
ncbi:hypothetical protein [Trinickia symbiotica]|uniref:hypothetical protein n=1 Tax=Trinickia symbiotica TaxID=863227 RepID=UPI0011B1E00F|nr:hypothetical protein [Trinickia symbiotica]